MLECRKKTLKIPMLNSVSRYCVFFFKCAELTNFFVFLTVQNHVIYFKQKRNTINIWLCVMCVKKKMSKNTVMWWIKKGRTKNKWAAKIQPKKKPVAGTNGLQCMVLRYFKIWNLFAFRLVSNEHVLYYAILEQNFFRLVFLFCVLASFPFSFSVTLTPSICTDNIYVYISFLFISRWMVFYSRYVR